MSKPLDRLFREKLESHQIPPRDAAWSKVEASLSKKKKGITWFRAAAAIVLLGTVTAAVLWVGSEEEHVIAKVDSVRVAPKPQAPPAPKKKPRVEEPKLPAGRSQSRKIKVFIAREENKKEEPTQQPFVQSEQPVAVVNETVQPTQRENPETANKKSSITLTYTLAPIPSQERAVTVAEERKGLQKVVDVAKEAKNSEGVLTELRIMKDDLFALNFKKSNKK